MSLVGGGRRFFVTLVAALMLLAAVPSTQAALAKTDSLVTSDGGGEGSADPEEKLCEAAWDWHWTADGKISARATVTVPDELKPKQYEWYVDEERAQSGPKSTFSWEFTEYGDHKVDLRVICEDITEATDTLAGVTPDGNQKQRVGEYADETTNAAALVESPLISDIISLAEPDIDPGEIVKSPVVTTTKKPVEKINIVDPPEKLPDDDDDENDPGVGGAGDESQGGAVGADEDKLAGDASRGLLGTTGARTAVSMGVVLSILFLAGAGTVSTVRWVKKRWGQVDPEAEILRFETPMGSFVIAPVETEA